MSSAPTSIATASQIGYTTVSTGKPGHETPTGIFTILQKDKDHHSSKYNNAPMPYQERLTYDGVALHAGGLPGYPESHGCVHLPSKFAEDLFGASHMGMTVVVVNAKTAPADVVHPAALAPVDASTGAADIEARLQAGEKWRWQPEKSPEGPVSIVMSGADQRVIVVRNGVEIGRSRVDLHGSRQAARDPCVHRQGWRGARRERRAEGGSRAKLDGRPHAGLRRRRARTWRPLWAGACACRRTLPGRFTRCWQPGTTLLVTDAPVLEENSGTSMTVMGAGNPNAPAG